jgi:hypothetical protein
MVNFENIDQGKLIKDTDGAKFAVDAEFLKLYSRRS